MRRSVTVLGIHDGHGAGAALVRNGSVLAAVQEERLTNIKNYSGVPLLAIPEVFRISQVDPAEVDVIAVGCLVRVSSPVQGENRLPVRLFRKAAPLLRSHAAARSMVRVFHSIRPMHDLNTLFDQIGLRDKDLAFVDHHLSHAAGAFYQRPWRDDTLVLTLDGAGDGISATVNIGSGTSIRRIASTTFYDSPGNNLYSEVTGYLGLKRWEHEHKVMGLAPYGRPEPCLEAMRRIVRIHPKRPLEFQNTIGRYSIEIQSRLQTLIAGRRFDDIASACQQHFEDLVTAWIRNAIRETGIGRVACSGGMFLNVKANMRIRRLPEVESAFFHPTPDDGGTPVGAALEAYVRFCERERIDPACVPVTDLYLGREFSDEAIEAALADARLRDHATRVESIEEAITDLLVRGKIIARFHGREEWGPRALGNRSIVADPRDPRVVQRINQSIKGRDFWMPFAPSMLEESADAYLDEARPAPYMVEAFDTKPRAEDLIAALHPRDRTARPQTVTNWDPGWRRILEGFRDRVGVAGILNTSFNLHGFPLVGSPEQALSTFQNSELDALAIGSWLVLK